MAAYRRVYDSQQADCQEPGSVPEPYARLRHRVWATLFLPHDVLCNDSELGYNCAERKQVATHSVATARIAAA